MDENVKKVEPLYITSGNIKWHGLLKSLAVPQKATIGFSIHLLHS